ncbi:MAG: methyltransferase domain-containing protein [Actinomycetota bacterium]
MTTDPTPTPSPAGHDGDAAVDSRIRAVAAVDGDDIHEQVQAYYRQAATSGDVSDACDERWGTARYDDDTVAAGGSAAELSMGCGNPFALADLAPGETVLDLGSGGGLDVILSARRVAPDGHAYGVDFLDEMIATATANAAEADVANVTFLKGMIEDVPLPDASVDVVISNCVINLAPDKRPVFAEMARVLRPGGRIAISDVVAEDDHTPSDDGAAWADCGAGALGRSTYLAMLADVGLADASIEYTHETGPGLHGAAVRARKP